MDKLASNVEHETKEEHASTVGVSEEEATQVRILDFLAAWLLQKLLKLLDKSVDIGLAEANNCTVVDDDVGKKGVRLLVHVDSVSLHLLLSSLVTPLEPTHGNNTDDHDWSQCCRDQSHLPVDEESDH